MANTVMIKIALALYICLTASYIAWTTVRVEKLRASRERCIEVVEMYHSYVKGVNESN